MVAYGGEGVGVPVGAGVGCSMNWAWVPVRKGAVTIERAMVAAASAPWERRTRWRQRSMPAAVPAAVQMLSSSMKRASGTTFTRGWCVRRRSIRPQWVIARRPSSRPAWARVKAPPHRAARVVPRAWARRRASRTGAGAGVTWSSRPGTRIRSARESQVRVRSGARARPPRIGTEALSVATRRRSKAGAPRSVRSVPQTSVMTDTSKARMPGKATRATRYAGSTPGSKPSIAVFRPAGVGAVPAAGSKAWISRRTQRWWSSMCRRASRSRTSGGAEQSRGR